MKPSAVTAPTAARPHAALRAPVAFDPERVREDFPALSLTVHGRPLVYLDNAATAHKPEAVLAAERAFYETMNANVHRGVHTLSERATEAYEDARAKVARLVGAPDPDAVVWTRGTTEAVNLVAWSFVRPRLKPGDTIVITGLEHHSNIVPWQMLCEETGATLAVAPIDDRGVVDAEAFARLVAAKGARFAAFAHVSNALGTVLPLADMIAACRAHGVPTLVDGAQAVPHLPVDFAQLGADFYAFSGHKVFGPTGIGALIGTRERLEAMRPWQGGGDMIASVTFEKTTYNKVPWKFEAGTPNIAGAIGLGAAADYLLDLDLATVAAYEHDLLAYATQALSAVPGLTLVGTAPDKASVLSFTLAGIHPHDVGTIVDQEGVAIRTGHHCAQPVMERFGIAATARASLALYNTRADIDALVLALAKVREVFGA